MLIDLQEAPLWWQQWTALMPVDTSPFDVVSF